MLWKEVVKERVRELKSAEINSYIFFFFLPFPEKVDFLPSSTSFLFLLLFCFVYLFLILLIVVFLWRT